MMSTHLEFTESANLNICLICFCMKNTEIYMFEPPSNCRDIPKNALGEWYLNSSRICLLPDVEYKMDDDDRDYLDEKDPRMTTIRSSLHYDGRVITLSFHVIAPDTIRMYLYWNGQIIRFFPEDIRKILPSFFEMKYGLNQSFVDKPDMDEAIGRLKDKLKDSMFTGFQEADW